MRNKAGATRLSIQEGSASLDVSTIVKVTALTAPHNARATSELARYGVARKDFTLGFLLRCKQYFETERSARALR